MEAPDEELARRLWNESADAYHAFIEAGLDYYRAELHGPALLAAVGDVRGRDALDLGAGQGWFSRELAAAGARVTGVDWSRGLLAHARELELRAPLGVTYEELDAAELRARFAPASFDVVTACMSLMDMPHPGAVLAAARAVLREGGRVVVSIPNPVTDSPYRAWERDASGAKLALKLDRYFEGTPAVMEWNMKRLAQHFRTVQYRYTLEAWSRMVEAAGLVILRMREPRPTADMITRCPELADAARLPYFLILDLRPG